MKHGDKAKSKAASKASGKKSGATKAAASSKADAKSSKASSEKQSAGKTEKQNSKAAADNGSGRRRVVEGADGFSNSVVANAFKRAIKKYPNAFRKLTD
jgi:hypothetical protein